MLGPLTKTASTQNSAAIHHRKVKYIMWPATGVTHYAHKSGLLFVLAVSQVSEGLCLAVYLVYLVCRVPLSGERYPFVTPPPY